MTALGPRRTDGFSTGEKMKVAIARALIHDPQNVLLDEPTNGLDVLATRAMRDLVRSLRDQGKCVLFSSHIMQEVTALCERIVVVDHGRVVAIGTADELLAQSGKATLEDGSNTRRRHRAHARAQDRRRTRACAAAPTLPRPRTGRCLRCSMQ